ncbi:hypothetical protein WJX81_003826 [Elliptochloris bilobata]|uniref:Uncharacterized protein n=1 Tax=Elliptochloris bilobata TaxID=381761 RepID=A0AAW1S2I4_9CHLO
MCYHTLAKTGGCSWTPELWDYSSVLAPAASEVLAFEGLPGFTRSVYARDHALITPESRVWQPGGTNVSVAYLISPTAATGANFAMFLATMGPDALAAAPPTGVERFLFVLDGAARLEAESAGVQVDLGAGAFAYLPPDTPHCLTSTAGAGLLLFERRYALARAGGRLQVLHGQTDGQPVLPVPGEVFALRKLLPQTADHDFNVHVMDFQPGEYLFVKEVHYNQHGMLMAAGRGVYRLADAWYPVQQGDAIWMAPYVLQWYGALGTRPTRYILYKDTTLNPLASPTRPSSGTFASSAAPLSPRYTSGPESAQKLKWRKGDVRAEYDFVRELSHTTAESADTVWLVRHRKTGETLACKRISKRQEVIYRCSCRVGGDAGNGWRHEAEVMARVCDHRNIVQLYEVYEDTNYVYILMEPCLGGELFDLIVERGHLTERDAAVKARALLEVIQHCHSRGVVHRDLKPENFLLKAKHATVDHPCTQHNVRCIDFGSAAIVKPGQQLRDVVGSSYYVSPECLKGSYSFPTDLWSAGVIIYIMLSGLPPFNGANTREVFRAIVDAPLNLDCDPWQDISAPGKDFVRRLLHKDPRKRMRVTEALAHPWVCVLNAAPNARLSGVVVERLVAFTRSSRLERALLNLVAKHLSRSDIGHLEAMFKALDTDGDGRLSAEDLRGGLGAVGRKMSSAAVESLVSDLDISGCGSLDLEEFIAAALNRQEALNAKTLAEVFDKLDDDDDGEIGARALSCALQECHIDMSEEALNGLLEKEGVTPDRKLGVPIMHAETFKRIMLHEWLEPAAAAAAAASGACQAGVGTRSEPTTPTAVH